MAARGLAGGDSVNFLLRSAEVLLLFKNAYVVSASVSSIIINLFKLILITVT